VREREREREREVSKVSKHIWRLGPLLAESSSPAIVCTASSDGGFRATIGLERERQVSKAFIKPEEI
jgi:hypothetical protein